MVDAAAADGSRLNAIIPPASTTGCCVTIRKFVKAFLVEELLAVAVSSGALVRDAGSWTLSGTADHVVPLTFADSIRRRIAALGEEGRVVLLGAAVLGRRFDWKLLPAVTGLGEGAVVRALQAAVETPTSWRLTLARVRSGSATRSRATR